MPSTNEIVVIMVAVHYVLKFINYERIRVTKGNGRRLKRFSASVEVKVLKNRGTKVLHTFLAYFDKDKRKWVVLGRSNWALHGDLDSRAVATLNRHFPNGVVNTTKSAAA